MFKKPDSVTVAQRSALRGKEAKALRQQVASLFPASLRELDALFARLGERLEAVKLGAGLRGYAPEGGAGPSPEDPLAVAPGTLVFVDLDAKAGGARLCPTLAALWLCPSLLPTVVVPPPVSEFLVGGADLMLPGALLPLPRFRKGDLVAVRVAGNPLAIAVGEATMSSADCVDKAGMRGRGLRAVLHFGDCLWDLCGRVRPNEGFRGAVVAPVGEEREVAIPRSIAAASISCIAPSSSAATMIRIASAPIARASATCQGSTMKSLRSTGSAQAARAAIR
jgi:translation initiation factor 2D